MATLETLPAELRIQVLEQIPDITSLHNLVDASLTYRYTYSRTRKTVLHELATRIYSLVGVAEPLAAIHSEGLYAEVAPNKEAIIDLLDRRREPELDPREARLTSQTQTVPLLQLYQKLEPALTACAPTHRAVSTTEKARLLRALCRLQTYCNIFGAREWAEPEGSAQDRMQAPNLLKRRSTTWHRQFTIDEVWDLFFRTMPPWEVEEFGSVWTLMRQVYVDLFASIARDFPRNSPQWRNLRPASMPLDPSELFESAEDEYQTFEYDDYCNHLVSLGPAFLSRVLEQPTEDDRRRLLASNSIPAKSSFMDLVRVATQTQPLLPPADRYEVANIGAILPTLPVLDQPAPAWKHHWYGDAPVHQVMFAPRSVAAMQIQEWSEQTEESDTRTLGYFAGWTSGYALWDAPVAA